MRLAVLLAQSDPHPHKGSPLVSEWWGREIEVSGPLTPQEEHNCGTEFLWKITGPRELTDMIKRHRLGFFVCMHQIQLNGGMQQHERTTQVQVSQGSLGAEDR